MEKEFNGLENLLIEQWNTFQNNLPAIILALFILIVGLFIINQLRKISEKIIEKRSRDSLATSFLVNIIALVLTLFLLAVVMNVLGWSSFTNKILAAAGIGTFVIGFALKDIGENFLAGIIMAFRRPFRMGDLVKIDSIKGRVIRMSLRETTVKTLDGKDVYIPNGMILKLPLENYTIDNYYRNDFIIGLDYDDNITEALEIIEEVLYSFQEVEIIPAPLVAVSELAASTVNVSVRFWFKTNDISAPGVKLRSDIMLKTYKTLLEKGFGLPSDIVEVRMINQKPNSISIK